MARFYESGKWQKEYENRVTHYITNLEKYLGDHFRLEFDGEQVKELARQELELVYLDMKINSDKLDFASVHLLKQRQEVRKSIQIYRNNLLLTMNARLRLKVDMKQKESKEDRLRALFSNSDLKE